MSKYTDDITMHVVLMKHFFKTQEKKASELLKNLKEMYLCYGQIVDSR